MEHGLQPVRCMTPKRALQIILGLGLVGTAFSGTLSYQELFAGSIDQCPAPGPAGTVLGYPACVYGFFMFALVAGVAAWGLLAGRRAARQHELDPCPDCLHDPCNP